MGFWRIIEEEERKIDVTFCFLIKVTWNLHHFKFNTNSFVKQRGEDTTKDRGSGE